MLNSICFSRLPLQPFYVSAPNVRRSISAWRRSLAECAALACWKMGQTSCGAGCVLNLLPASDESALRLSSPLHKSLLHPATPSQSRAA
jgi:hypothetical protein